MVVLTVATAAVVVTAGAAAPAAAGVGAGIVQTAATGAATGAAVAGSAGAGAAAGAITGAAVGGTAGASAVGAAVGAGGAAAVTSSSAGAAGITAGLAAGPVGWLALGAEEDDQLKTCTWDCWKPVLRDESPEPSKGMLFKDVAMDQRVRKVDVVGGSEEFPHMVVKNIWGERFEIQYVGLETGMALHAQLIPI